MGNLDVKCGECGQDFKARKGQVYCSASCRLASYEKARDALRSKPRETACLVCGGKVVQVRGKGALRFFCSQECADFEHLARRLEAHVLKVVPKCGAEEKAWLARRFAVVVARFTGAL